MYLERLLEVLQQVRKVVRDGEQPERAQVTRLVVASEPQSLSLLRAPKRRKMGVTSANCAKERRRARRGDLVEAHADALQVAEVEAAPRELYIVLLVDVDVLLHDVIVGIDYFCDQAVRRGAAAGTGT